MILEEKWIRLEVGGYLNVIPESKLEESLAMLEGLRKEYLEKGAPPEMVEDALRIRILKDED